MRFIVGSTPVPCFCSQFIFSKSDYKKSPQPPSIPPYPSPVPVALDAIAQNLERVLSRALRGQSGCDVKEVFCKFNFKLGLESLMGVQFYHLTLFERFCPILRALIPSPLLSYCYMFSLKLRPLIPSPLLYYFCLFSLKLRPLIPSSLLSYCCMFSLKLRPLIPSSLL